uniref:ABC transporter permease n=1 Tax=candidate division CPR3 bacterium TaxID=2268181 RepID=A0A7C5UR97_UNCC3
MKEGFKMIYKKISYLLNLFDLSFKNVLRRKVRTFLTSSSVMIGTVLIVVMVSLGLGVNKWLVDEISTQTDLKLVTVFPPQTAIMSLFSVLGASDKSENKEKTNWKSVILSKETVEEFKKIPGVFSVTPVMQITVDAAYLEGSNVPISRLFTESIDFEQNPYYVKNVVAGDPFALNKRQDGVVVTTFFAGKAGVLEEDYNSLIGKKVTLVIPTKVAPTGFFAATVESKTIDVFIVGVIDVGLRSEDLFLNTERAISILSEAANLSKEEFLNNVGYYSVLIKTYSEKDTERIANTIEELGFKTVTAKDYINMVNRIFSTVQVALSAFGIVALVVASIGIANTMVMSIYERTKEIGIMKAIGASRWTIRLLFLIESGVLGVFGGFTGVLLGYVLDRIGDFVAFKVLENSGIVIEKLFYYPPWLALSCIVFSFFVGVIAGIYPANRASLLDPVVAIKYE